MLDRRQNVLSCAPNERREYDWFLRGDYMQRRQTKHSNQVGALLLFAAVFWPGATVEATEPAGSALSPTNIFAPVSTPAQSIFDLSVLILIVTGTIFVVVFSLLAYAAIKFRKRQPEDGSEPVQVYGSTQLELAWTVIPVLIVVVLFLAAARVIASIQNTAHPSTSIEVTVIGHQFWWEYRYPSLGVVTANELHIPVSDPAHPTPTFLTLLSADTDHSFWVPRLAGKTDLIPNHPTAVRLNFFDGE